MEVELTGDVVGARSPLSEGEGGRVPREGAVSRARGVGVGDVRSGSTVRGDRS